MNDRIGGAMIRSKLANDGTFDDEGSTGALACMVLDLCDNAANRLTKAAFIRLAQPTSR